MSLVLTISLGFLGAVCIAAYFRGIFRTNPRQVWPKQWVVYSGDRVISRFKD